MPVDLNRRWVIAALAALAVQSPLSRMALAAVQAEGEPVLVRVARGSGVIHILGYAEATDNSWFVPKIARTLEEANVLWLETPPGSGAAAAEGQAAAPDPELARVFSELAVDPSRDLFTVLSDPVAERTLHWAGALGIPRETLSPMRPWFARITIQQAYAARRQTGQTQERPLVSPERIVVDRARARGIPIESEYPTIGDLMRFFAELPPAAQPQYLEELFDYFDRTESGINDAGRYGWMTGSPSTLSIDQQRERTPDLYRAMHIERNAWWTGRIEGLLAEGAKAFIMLGNNHMLGPDSVPMNMRRRGLPVELL